MQEQLLHELGLDSESNNAAEEIEMGLISSDDFAEDLGELGSADEPVPIDLAAHYRSIAVKFAAFRLDSDDYM